jgi:DNA-directed RNA polymerase specialized sigma24 family protein
MFDLSGPEETLADIYEEHVWHVYGFFAYHRLSRQDAEDLTQATFERAIRAYSRYDPARATCPACGTRRPPATATARSCCTR